MNNDNTNLPPTKNNKSLVVAGVALLFILIAGLMGWQIGHSGNKAKESSPNSATPPTSSSTASTSDPSSIITYTLPDGWKAGTCPNQNNVQFVVQSGNTLHCDADPIAPIRISVDPQNTTDCQELGNVQNVRKHICKSLFIDGHKTLQASTEYPKSSMYPVDTTISDYYINTGKGVIRIQYRYTSSNDYQLGFDQLANSVHVKV